MSSAAPETLGRVLLDAQQSLAQLRRSLDLDDASINHLPTHPHPPASSSHTYANHDLDGHQEQHQGQQRDASWLRERARRGSSVSLHAPGGGGGGGGVAGGGDAALAKLRRVLEATEAQLKAQAEDLLQYAARTEQDEEERLGVSLPQVYDAEPAPPRRRRRSATRRQKRQARRGVAMRKSTVREQMLAERQVRLLQNPHLAASRQVLRSRFGMPASDAPPPYAEKRVKRQRPINRYGKKGQLRRASMSKTKVLPALVRKSPHAPRPPITEEDAEQGVYHLQQRGYLPPNVDLTPVFSSGDGAVLRQQPAQFHSYFEQFEKSTLMFQSPYESDMTNFRLDLTHTQPQAQPLWLTDGSELQQQQQQEQELPEPEQDTPESSADEAPSSPVTEQPADELDFRWDEDVDLEAHARDFDELLDTYSLHRFIIRKGTILDTTPEFRSYRRKYAFMWAAIKPVLRRLLSFVQEHSVDLAFVNGQRVVELANRVLAEMTDKESSGDELAREIPAADLVMCFINAKQIIPKLKDPRLMFLGENGPQLAAMKIQATFRMWRDRTAYRHYLHLCDEARRIQNAWRGYVALRDTRQRLAGEWETKLGAWRELQEEWRGDWSRVSKKRRVEVHIPSMSMDAQQRLRRRDLHLAQNSQLGRLCAAKDPNVDVIYVSPFPLPSDIIAYYMKTLEVGGVATPERRVHILFPENHDQFPPHFSLARLAGLSPKLLRRIDELIAGRPACIVPGTVGEEDLRLAVHMNLPLYSAEPHVATVFGSKSGAKRIFASASVPRPLGVHDVYDEEDLFSHLSELILNNLHVPRWVLKIDNESGGRGTAYVDTDRLRLVRKLIRDPSALHDEQVLAASQLKLCGMLKRNLGRSVELACPEAYDGSWQRFKRAFLAVGGVIEASPPQELIQSSPSVNMLIEPNGVVSVTSTHDQIFSTPFVFRGALFPSTSRFSSLCKAATLIGRACFKEGIIGHVGVDFVVASTVGKIDGSSEDEEAYLDLWAVDLNLRMTQTACSFAMFDLVMGGWYESGRYWINPLEGEAQKGPRHRSYAMLDMMRHGPLGDLQIGVFFNLCRLAGISFDLLSRVGTTFFLVDSLASATVGALCCASHHVGALRSLHRLLEFLQNQGASTKTLRGAGLANDTELARLIETVRKLYARVQARVKSAQ